MTDDALDALLPTKEVAERFAVTVSTVSRWARDGLIPFVRTPGGTLRFRQSDVERLLADHGAPGPGTEAVA